MQNIRRQLSLFIDNSNAKIIEDIRCRYNPEQRKLIDCHVTLCRDDEIENLDLVLNNLSHPEVKKIAIEFGRLKRFQNGKGVLIPSKGKNLEFHKLRQQVLQGNGTDLRWHEPHITLMHPRNSSCTDAIFEEILKKEFPARLIFRKVSLIEQKDAEQWSIVKEIELSD